MSKASLSKAQASTAVVALPTRHPATTEPGAGNHGHDLPIDSDIRQSMIAEAAYLRAAQRGFATGHELDDWLAAERELSARLVDPVSHQAL